VSNSARSNLMPALSAFAAFVVLIGLGVWQLERKTWKEGLIDMMTRRIAAAPSDPPGRDTWATLDADNSEFRRVRFDADFIDVPDTYVYVAGSALRDDIKEPGYFVFRPARLKNGTTVVVNRGYVPLDYTQQSPPGHVEVRGYLRWPEKPTWFISASNDTGDTWFVRDQRAMAAKRGWGEVAPYYIDQENPVPPGGLPRPASLIVRFRNDHLQYAITWFALAGVLAGVFGVWLAGRLRNGPQKLDAQTG
jgi:cytochrome oxidase assembly protein ShyY1